MRRKPDTGTQDFHRLTHWNVVSQVGFQVDGEHLVVLEFKVNTSQGKALNRRTWQDKPKKQAKKE